MNARVFPSGENRGTPSPSPPEGGIVATRRSPVSGETSTIPAGPSVSGSAGNATNFPSGDHATPPDRVDPSASSRSEPPSADISMTDGGLPPRQKAIRRPSGDQAGA